MSFALEERIDAGEFQVRSFTKQFREKLFVTGITGSDASKCVGESKRKKVIERKGKPPRILFHRSSCSMIQFVTHRETATSSSEV